MPRGVVEGRLHVRVDLTGTAESGRGQPEGAHSVILFLRS